MDIRKVFKKYKIVLDNGYIVDIEYTAKVIKYNE